MEDRIPGGLQHHHKTCCEKGGRHGRQACMVQKWFHRGDVVSGQVDLHMTRTHILYKRCLCIGESLLVKLPNIFILLMVDKAL